VGERGSNGTKGGKTKELKLVRREEKFSDLIKLPEGLRARTQSWFLSSKRNSRRSQQVGEINKNGKRLALVLARAIRKSNGKER